MPNARNVHLHDAMRRMTSARTDRPEGPWKLLEVLNWTVGHFTAKGLGSPRLDAEVLLSHVLGLPRIMLYARFDQPLLPAELEAIRALVARRARHEPIAYLIGHREFFSLEFEVNPSVLIPRPDTELLVEVVLERLKDLKSLKHQDGPRIADVGTGSGCIAVALAIQRPDARIYAIDRSPGACDVARRNCERHDVADRVTVLDGDLLDALPGSVTLDAVAANLPYVPEPAMNTLMADVRDFEPRQALTGGLDGLDVIRRLLAQCASRLTDGALVALEADPEQVERLRPELEASGFGDVRAHTDASGGARVASALRAHANRSGA